MGKKPLGQKPFVQSSCSVCGHPYKNYKIIGGSMVKRICDCNKYLIDEECQKVRERQERKRK